MFTPLNDDTPMRVIRVQYITAAIIFLNVAIFLWTGAMRGDEALMITATGFGVVPTELLDLVHSGLPELNPVGEPLTLVTYMFLHGGWLHLLGNMLFLWVFADNIEDVFGHTAFVFFYLLTGIAGALLHVAFNPGSNEPLIGASAAVSGVLASYLLLFPRARILVLIFMAIPMRLPAIVVLGGWMALQIYHIVADDGSGQAIAWWAHIGGFAAGALLTLIFKSRLRLAN
jgi:membrane associated rhomboid family serine protease